MDNEKRRMELAEQSFSHIVQSGTVEVPQTIIAGFHKCITSDQQTENTLAELTHELKSFADRGAPRFVDNISAEEKLFAETLSVDFQKGNLSAVDADRLEAEKAMIPLLADLKLNIETLMKITEQKIAESTVDAETAEASRSELQELLEEAMESLAVEKQPLLNTGGSMGGFDMKMLAPLLEALKATQQTLLATPNQVPLVPNVYDDLNDDEDDDEDNDGNAEKKPGDDADDDDDGAIESPFDNDEEDEAFTIFGFIDHVDELAMYDLMPAYADVDQAVVDAVLNSEALSLSQKEEILNSAGNDMILMANIVDSEMRQMEDMIKSATEVRPPAVDASEETIAQKHAVEQALLQEQLQAERAVLLHAISEEEAEADQTIDTTITTTDQAQQHTISAVSLARRTVRLRLAAVETRLEFAELRLELDKERLQRQRQQPSSEDVLASVNGEETAAMVQLLTECREKGRKIAEEEESIAKELQSDSISADEQVEILGDVASESLSVFRTRFQQIVTSRMQYHEDMIRYKRQVADQFSLAFDTAERQEILSRVAEEEVKYRNLIQTLDSSDEGVFSAEEETILDIVANAAVWSSSVDYITMQNSLHTRIIAGKYFELDNLKRCKLIEEEFKRETLLLQASIELTQAAAGRGEIETSFYNINKNAKDAAMVAIRDLETERLEIISEEKTRQSSVSLDYEREYLDVVIANCLRNASLSNTLALSHSKVWKQLRDTLSDKKDLFSATLEEQKQPYILQSYLQKQIENEILREDYEMKAVYEDVLASWTLVDRYHSEVIEGFEPSVEYARDLLSLTSQTQQIILVYASRKDIERKKYQLLISQNAHVENEAKRLMMMGRSADALIPIYKNIEVAVSAELALFQAKILADNNEQKEDMLKELQEKLDIQQDLENEIIALKSTYMDQLSTLDSTNDNSGNAHDADRDADDKKAMVTAAEGDQMTTTYLKKKSILLSKYQDNVCDACKRAVNRASALYSVYDEMHTQRQFEQQKFEALQYVVEKALESNFLNLMKTQQSRRNLGAALINEYEKDLKGLENVLADKKYRQNQFLKDRLEKRKALRENELLKSTGLTPDEIARIVEEEYEHDLEVGEGDIEARIQEEEEREVQAMELNQSAALDELDKVEDAINASALALGFDSLTEQAMLEFTAEMQRINDAHRSAGEEDMTDEERAAAAAAYLREKKRLLDEVGQSTREHLKLDEESDAHRLELAHIASLESLSQEFDVKKKASQSALEKRLAALRDKRQTELVEAGLSAEEAEAQVDRENKALVEAELATLESEHQEAKTKVQGKFAKLMDALRTQYVKSQDILAHGTEEHAKRSLEEIMAQLLDEKFKNIEALLAAGMSRPEAEAKAEAEYAEKLAVKRAENEALIAIAAGKVQDLIADTFEARARVLRAEHESKIVGLAAAQAREKEESVKALKKRLEKRKDRRVAGLEALGIDQTEADAIAAVEFNDIAHQLAEFETQMGEQQMDDYNKKSDSLAKYRKDYETEQDKLDVKEDKEASKLFEQVIQTERELAARFEETAAAACEALLQASQDVKEVAESEIKDWRDKYERDCKRLEDELLTSKAKEKSLLRAQLEARRRKREAELLQQGVNAEAASKLATEELEQEEAKALETFDVVAAEEQESLHERLRAEGEAEEKELIRKRHAEAAKATLDADLERQAAQAKLEALRQQQREESKKLEDSIAANKKSNESKLKSRLAEKRATALKDLETMKRSEAEKQRLLKQLEEEEHAQMLELHRKNEEEEARQREEQTKRHEALLSQLEKEAKEKELEAVAQAAREAALLALQEVQQRSEEEKNQKNLQRLREQHNKEEERLREAAQQQKAQGQGKLADRLAQKRAAREKELAEKEAKAMQELAAKQALEQQEREKAQAAKMLWTDKLALCMSQAVANGFEEGVAEWEDYCLQTIMAAKIVPHNQVYEAMERIVNTRHSSEMAALLKKNFNDRIATLKAAVQTVLDEKANARLKLLETLSASGADEDAVAQSLREMEEQYSAQQLAVEAQVTRDLEPTHMQQQISLRQQQIQDVAHLVTLYSDPEALAQLQANTKSQAQELEEYRLRVEGEKRVREEKLASERREIEERMKQQHEAEMRRMQEELQREVARSEAAYEVEKKALLERKEQMERSQADEKGTLDKQEKERILLEFEKEHNAAVQALEKEKVSQKRKLQDRLAAKRQIKATRTPVVPVGMEKKVGQITNMWNKLAKRKSSLTADIGKSNTTEGTVGAGGKGGTATPAAATETVRRNSLANIGKNLKNAMTAVAASASQGLSGGQSNANPQFNAAIAQIEAKLERIEKVINAIAISGPTTTGAVFTKGSLEAGGSGTGIYKDDNEPHAGDSLILVTDEVSELAVQESTRLAFGRRLAALLGLKDITLKAAISLPPSKYTNHAFPNSYLIDASTHTLYVHKERLSSSGDFGLLVMHAFSHFKVNPIDCNDSDPVFVAEFYKNLKILSQDLFRKTVSNESRPAGLTRQESSQASPKRRTSLSTKQRQPSISGGSPKPILGAGGGGGERRNSFNFNTAAAAALIAASLDTTSTTPSGGVAAAGARTNTSTATAALVAENDAEYFASSNLLERVKQYAIEGGIPIEFVERYAEQSKQDKKT